MGAGRPREFDYDKALEQAMHVFWEKGYEGTSMPDLTDAMGMNRPSIYAAFGNKEELYRKALERYSEKALEFFREKLAAPKIRDAIEGFLCGAVSSFSCGETPKGCLAVQGALVGSDDAENVCHESASTRKMMVNLLHERFKKAQKDGELDDSKDPKALAGYIAALLHGLSIQSASGFPEKELKAIAKTALSILPE